MKGRTQTVTPRPRKVTKSRRRSGSLSPRRIADLAVRFGKPGILLVSAVVLIIAYNRITESKAFSLRSIEISGASPGLEAEVKQAVQQTVGQSKLLDVPLESLLAKVEAIPRVRTATVMRKLPDSIRVEVNERQAVLPVRKGQAVEWIDADAVDLGDVSSIKLPGGIPPVATGFSTGPPSLMSIADDKARIGRYKQIEQDLSAEPNPRWNLVDEVDLSYVNEVRIRLIRPPYWIFLGNPDPKTGSPGDDIRSKTEEALKVFDAIKRGDSSTLSRLGVQEPDLVIQQADQILYLNLNGPNPALGFLSSRQDSRSKKAPATIR